MGSTVMYRSLKVLGFVEDVEGSWFVTLNTYVVGSTRLTVGRDWKWIFRAEPMTGHDKLSWESLIILNEIGLTEHSEGIFCRFLDDGGVEWRGCGSRGWFDWLCLYLACETEARQHTWQRTYKGLSSQDPLLIDRCIRVCTLIHPPHFFSGESDGRLTSSKCVIQDYPSSC